VPLDDKINGDAASENMGNTWIRRWCVRGGFRRNSFRDGSVHGLHADFGLYAIASISILVLMTARASTVVRASTASLKCSENTLL